jgi:hypothetical protein
MEENKLLIEINRINKLMGIELLNEQVPAGISLRLLRLIKNYGDNFFNFVENKVATNSILNRVGNQVVNLVETDIKVLLKHMTKEGAEKIAKEWYDNGLLISRRVIETYMDGRVSQIVKDRENYIKVCREIDEGRETFWGMFPQGQVPDYLNKTADEFAELFKKELDTIIEKDYPNIWKWVKEKGWASKTLREIEEMSIDAVELLYKKLNPGLVNAFVQKLTGNFKLLTLSAQEIQQLIAKYKNTLDSATRLQIEEIIDSSVIKLAQQSEETFKYMNKWIDDNLKGDSALLTLKSKLKSTDNWKMAETLAKTTSTDKKLLGLSEAWNTSMSHFKQLLRELRVFFHVKGWFKGTKGFEEELKKNYPSIFGSTDDINKVLRNWFLSGSKRGFPFRSNPNYNKIFKVAGTKTALLSYSAEVIMNIIKFHVLWAAVETFSEYVVHSFRGGFEDKEGKIPEILKNFIKDYKTTPKGSDYSDMFANFFKNILRNFVDDFTFKSGNLTQIIPGYWDNLANTVAEILFFGETEGFVKQEKVEKAVDLIKKEAEKVEDKIQNEIEKGKAEIEQDTTGSPVKTDTIPSSKVDTTYSQSLGGL